MEKRKRKLILTGYRAKGIELYKTKLKFLGYVVAGLGFGFLGVAVIPNGLGIVCYPLAVCLLGVVGINCFGFKKKIGNKIRFALWKLRR